MHPDKFPNSIQTQGKHLILAGLILSLARGLAGVPTVVTQPQSLEEVLGARVVLSAYASGSPAPSYGWHKDGIAIAGATNESLKLGPLGFADAGRYAVTVSNVFGATSSIPASLKVRLPRAGDLDPSFNAGSDFDDFATQVKLMPDGKLLVGGEFTTVHGALRGRLARFNADGSLDQAFLNGMTGANSNITSVTAQPDGNIIVAGPFSRFNGVTRNRMARIRPDGSLDDAFFAGSNFWSSGISTVALQPDGRILVGGSFTNLNGTIRNRLLRLTAAGALDTQFLNGLSGANNLVQAILVQPDNQIVVAGSFTTMNGVLRNRIARLNGDGSLDDTFGNALATAPSITGAALQPDGKILIIGNGSFVSSNGVSRPFLARLNADGTMDTNFLNNLSGPAARVGRVRLMGGRIYISGDFWEVNGQPSAGLACLNPDGSVDAGVFGSFLGTGGAYKTVSDLARDEAGGVILAGAFTSINGRYRPYVARLHPDGTLDQAFMPASGADGIMAAAGLLSDGRIVVGGFFTNIGAHACENLVRLNQNGTVDAGFQGAGVNGYVTTILPHSDDHFTVAGTFTRANGWGRNRMARFNPDGSLDHTFLEGMTGFEFSKYSEEGIFDAAIQPDGKVIAGGDYGRVNGIARTNIARLDINGALDMSFASNAPNDWVKCVAVQTNGGVLLGGYFTAINGQNRNGLARLLPNGTLDNGYAPVLLSGSGIPARIEKIALQPDGKLLLHGDFYRINGIIRPSLARLNADGSLDVDFLKNMSGPDGSVSAVRVQNSGKILLGGSFETINGISCKGIARLNEDGSVDPSFVGSVGPLSYWRTVSSFCEQPDGRILLVGGFNQYNGHAMRCIVRIYGDAVPLPGLTIERSGAQAAVSWPSYYTGWKLQKQELLAGGGISTNWVDMAGSEKTNRVFLAISGSSGAWLRLAQPE